MNADQQIQQLSELLGLKEEPQDWGIINADPTRVLEFIRFCETTALTPVQQYVMGELVLASMNDALLDGMADAPTVAAFKRFLTGNFYELPTHIRYWSSLTNADEFPLADWLKHPVSSR
jgi:hypothetical protein